MTDNILITIISISASVMCSGQASSPNAEAAGAASELIANIGWNIASSTVTSSRRDVTAAGFPLSVTGLSARAQDFHRRVKNFIEERVLPVEQDVLNWHSDPQTKWIIHPRIEQLKVTSHLSLLFIIYQFTYLLHWLDVTERIQFRVAATVYKCVHGMAPAYLTELYSPIAASTSRRGMLRSATTGNLVIPRCSLSTYATRAFSVAGPVCWNALPDYLKSPDLSFDRFRHQLKTFLFCRYQTQHN